MADFCAVILWQIEAEEERLAGSANRTTTNEELPQKTKQNPVIYSLTDPKDWTRVSRFKTIPLDMNPSLHIYFGPAPNTVTPLGQLPLDLDRVINFCLGSQKVDPIDEGDLFFPTFDIRLLESIFGLVSYKPEELEFETLFFETTEEGLCFAQRLCESNYRELLLEITILSEKETRCLLGGTKNLLKQFKENFNKETLIKPKKTTSGSTTFWTRA